VTASKFATFDQIGQAEDVSDVISTLTPTETPFLTAIGSKSTNASTFEWQEDSLAAVAVNANVEGADAPAASMTATTMRSNYHQLFMKTVSVTGKAEAIRTYGRASELAYQLGKKGKEIKRDLEHALIGLDTAKTAGSDGVSASKFASAYQLINSGVTNSNSGTPRAFSEAILIDVLKKVWTANGDVKLLMIKPADAEIVANMAFKTQGTDAPARTRDLGNGSKVVNCVNVYMGPLNQTVEVQVNRYIKTTEALAYDPSNWKIVWLRKWRKEPLAKTGDSEKFMLLGECSLWHSNFDASGRATDLS
jgi:hypothetical protein